MTRSAQVGGGKSLRVECRDRRSWIWTVSVTIAVVLSGMAYSLWWAAVVRHKSWYWITPADIWYSVRTAHWIDWGSLSFVYSNPRSELITLPGFEVLLAPFVVLGSALGLSENAPGLFPNVHPQAWLLIGPISLASAALALFAFDGLAKRLGVGMGKRRVLTVFEAGALWPGLAMWGHPEDVLAVGLAALALSMLLDDRRAVAGWLLGGAIAMQLWVVLVLPAFVAFVGLRKGTALVARAVILPGFLFLAVAIPDLHDAVRTLLRQPAVPSVNHATPWVLLSPKLPHGMVAGGPARSIAIVVALGAGAIARTWRHDPTRVVWLMAMVLGARCVFDAVMVPYYVMPAVALALVAAATAPPARFALTAIAAAGLTVMTFTHHGLWEYWLMMTALIGAVLGMAWPGETSRPLNASTAALSEDTGAPVLGWREDDDIVPERGPVAVTTTGG
jgi:hypothetical protein